MYKALNNLFNFLPVRVKKRFSLKNYFFNFHKMDNDTSNGTNQTIGIIGYGKLGHVIAERSEELGYKVLTSDDDKQNAELAHNSGILTLCVKPNKASEIANQIRGSIDKTNIVSFMAAIPAAKLEQEFGVRVERAMTNLGLDSISCTNGNPNITEFCRRLSRGKMESVSEEAKIDLFTIGIGCLPGIAAWFFENHQMKADQWLNKWADFLYSKLGIDREIFAKIIKGVKENGNYAETVQRVKTPGGITQAMLEKLEENPNISFEEILSAATTRTKEIAEKT